MSSELPDNTAITVGLAVVTSIARIVYDNDEIKPIRVCLEATLCGCLSVAACYGISALGLEMEWAVFSGGVIGFLGADFIRYTAQKYVKNNIKG